MNTLVPAHELEKIRDEAWLTTNKKNLTDYKKGMKVDKNTGEVHESQ